jgi:Tfp pilus assembly protein PilN
MPLRLNLHHEIDRLQAQRKRDPLKISIFILVGIVALFAALYAKALVSFSMVDGRYKAMKRDFDAAEPAAKQAVEKEASLQKTVAAGNGLVQRIESRFHWSPVLEQLANLVPREVQITKLGGQVQGGLVKKVDISVDGVAAGTDPRKVAEDLRLSLVENLSKNYKNVTAAFRQLEESQDHASLDGKDWPTATFAITIQLQSGEEATTPVPRVPRKR